jgi:hypothetical protein
MKEIDNEHIQLQPYWKRLYNSLGLWISLYLMVIALGVYIITVDSAFATHQQIKSQLKNISKSLTSPTNESSKINKHNNIDRSKTMVTDDKGLQAIDEK